MSHSVSSLRSECSRVPSSDHVDGCKLFPVANKTVSPPPDGCRKRFRKPPIRFEPNAIQSPSGDHTGFSFRVPSVVNTVSTSRSIS